MSVLLREAASRARLPIAESCRLRNEAAAKYTVALNASRPTLPVGRSSSTQGEPRQARGPIRAVLRERRKTGRMVPLQVATAAPPYCWKPGLGRAD